MKTTLKHLCSRARYAARLTLTMVFLFVASASQAFASGGGINFGLNQNLQQFIDYATGPIAITIGTLIIIGGLVAAAVKGQRGEKWGPVLVPIIVVFLILNVENITDAFFTAGATM